MRVANRLAIALGRPRAASAHRLVTAVCFLLLATVVRADTRPVEIGAVSGLTGEVVVIASEGERSPIDWESLDWGNKLADSRASLGQAIRTGDIVLTRGGVVQLRFIHPVEGTEMGQFLAECRLANFTEVHLSSWQTVEIGRMGEDKTSSIFELRRGEAHCKTFAHGLSMRMRWNAGSSTVLIKGTELTLVYFPADDRLTVTVAEGEVVVAGPQGSRIVETGQTIQFVRGVPQDTPPA